MSTTRVYPAGSKVKIADGSIEATIVQISITATETKYEVVYWSGNERKNTWVYEFEITPLGNKTEHITGFHNA